VNRPSWPALAPRKLAIVVPHARRASIAFLLDFNPSFFRIHPPPQPGLASEK